MKEKTLQLNLEAWTPRYCMYMNTTTSWLLYFSVLNENSHIEVGHQHYTHQHWSTQIIKALSFSTNMQDVKHFLLVSFHNCAMKSASTHGVTSVDNELQSHAKSFQTCFDKNLVKWYEVQASEKVLKISAYFKNFRPFCTITSMLIFAEYFW